MSDNMQAPDRIEGVQIHILANELSRAAPAYAGASAGNLCGSKSGPPTAAAIV
jgi:hypothetical protein